MTEVTSRARQSLERLEWIQREPVEFAREVLRWEPWSKQRDVLNAVRDHRRVAVRSAHGVGKTAVAARVALWWLAAWPSSIVITTSATFGQVKEQLWREIAVAFRASGGYFPGSLTDTRLELAEDHFALGLSTDTPERFAGYHSDRLLVILDEASGVGEAVWEGAESLLTTERCHLLAIGNPTRPAGSFWRAFKAEASLYERIHISAEDSPAVTGEPVSEATRRRLVDQAFIDGRRQAWGERSPRFQVRVLGEFASTADDTVCAIEDVEDAQERELLPGTPVVIACDVARFGNDETVIALRRGGTVEIPITYRGRDTMHTAGAITRLARAAHVTAGEPPTIVVDEPGMGGGLVDRLRELGEFHVVAFNGAHAPRDPRDFRNRRSEAWFDFAEQLAEIQLPRDGQLYEDLVSARYTLDSGGRLVVESKSETKKRLGRSPDRADAVLMAFTVRTVNWEALEATREALRRGRRPRDPFDRFMRDRGDGSLREPGESIAGDVMTRSW